MTDVEREAENKRKVEKLREILNSHKLEFDKRKKDKGVGLIDR